jgi:hypothetical protein
MRAANLISRDAHFFYTNTKTRADFLQRLFPNHKSPKNNIDKAAPGR